MSSSDAVSVAVVISSSAVVGTTSRSEAQVTVAGRDTVDGRTGALSPSPVSWTAGIIPGWSDSTGSRDSAFVGGSVFSPARPRPVPGCVCVCGTVRVVSASAAGSAEDTVVIDMAAGGPVTEVSERFSSGTALAVVAAPERVGVGSAVVVSASAWVVVSVSAPPWCSVLRLLVPFAAVVWPVASPLATADGEWLLPAAAPPGAAVPPAAGAGAVWPDVGTAPAPAPEDADAGAVAAGDLCCVPGVSSSSWPPVASCGGGPSTPSAVGAERPPAVAV
ncbi:hypothetical protein [Streptomyces violaceorubidus]|uniref:hypothetical protein n=1 Tax=Streptomyces violaceorubidus TaxID=284042 RepID=UPI0012FEAE9E|nr:hypothetical protein [Streptomyces violaceorubidus]